jgi:translocation and assembly module TamA
VAAIVRSSFGKAALLALVLSCGVRAPAAAFEIFGIKFFERENQENPEDVIGEPQRYTITFTVAGDPSGDIETTLQNASTLYGDRDEPASGAAGLLATARGDYQRLLYALYGVGRYGPTISIRVDGREAADVPPDATLADPAAVAVSVDVGPEFRFGQAAIVNRAPPPADPDDRVDSPEDAGFVSGAVARSGAVLSAGRLAVEEWREQGYAKARLADQRVEAAHDTATLDAQLTIDPGRIAVYGPVTVQGTERMDPAFTAFMAGLPEGREYDPDDLKRAGDRLARLGVFRSARLEEADAINPDGTLPFTLSVQERPLNRVSFGASYSTLDGAGVEASYLYRNLFGRAESLRFDARVAGVGSQAADDLLDLTYRAGVTFTKPGVYTPDTDFTASLFFDREVLEPYTRTGVNGQAGYTQLFTEDLSARLFAEGGWNTFDEEIYEYDREFSYAGLLAGVLYDGRDDKTNATGGFYAELVGEPFYEFEYGNPTLRMTAEGRAYLGFGEDDPLVLAGRLKIGSIVGAPQDEVAPDKLFFAGGGGSVRGYAYRNIGIPVDVDGEEEITGGRSLLEASAEARIKVTDAIGVVAFADAGLVGEESFPDFGEEPRVGAGLGLRYLTGLGPIRADVAVPLNPRDNDPSFAFYVGIGQAF